MYSLYTVSMIHMSSLKIENRVTRCHSMPLDVLFLSLTDPFCYLIHVTVRFLRLEDPIDYMLTFGVGQGHLLAGAIYRYSYYSTSMIYKNDFKIIWENIKGQKKRTHSPACP